MRKGVIGLALALSLSLIPAYSATPPKAGSVCAKQGITKTYKGKNYTCIKSEKKLVWNKGVVVKRPIPTPSTSPSSTDSQSPAPSASPIPVPTDFSISDSIDSCKLQDVSNPYIGVYGGGLYGGFNNNEKPVPSTGNVIWYLVPVDFPDLKGELDWRNRVDEQMRILSEYYEYISYGKLNITWRVYDSWITMPGTQGQYQIDKSGDYIATEKFWSDALAVVDPKIDFKGIQVVNFLLPRLQTVVKESAQGFPWTGDINKYNSPESKISSFTLLGEFFEASQRNYWSYWAHEYGHTLGIPHIAGSRTSSTYQQYDLMGNQDARRELSGWSRFAVTKWLEDKWVYCKLKQNINSELISLSQLNSREGSTKLIVIPLSTTKALILESRRATKFSGSNSIKGETDGVLAYIYDATQGHNAEYLYPATSDTDPVMGTNESLTVDGITIKVIRLGVKDEVLITKSS